MKIASILFFSYWIVFSYSQNICGFDELTSGNRTDKISNGNASALRGITDTIDLVFHLIHLGEAVGLGANITDAQVESAVLSLNRDFGAWPIHDNIAISPRGVNSEVFFRLACIDPEGKPSIGINRVLGTVVPSFRTQGLNIKPNNRGNFTEVTGLSDWDIKRYINIWVVHRIETPTGKLISGGALGANVLNFTQGQAGIFVQPMAVGCDPDGQQGFKLLNRYGKILSHEMGHYLGLLHTFEGNSCSENNCAIEGDRVCDTEPHDNSSPFPQDSSCSEYAECITREPIENIMNYAGQTCGNIFTQGQKDRMKMMIGLYYQNLINQGFCENIITSSKNPEVLAIKIYPNPTSEYLEIESGKSGMGIITSISGKLIAKINLVPGKNIVPIPFFASGIYVIRIETNRSVFSQLISVVK